MQSLEFIPTIPLDILLADDDTDDHFFFTKALEELSFQTQLTTMEDGEKLMTYLLANQLKLPDVLFLDHNMPRKNGAECLKEIKNNPILKSIPVIMYSTYLHEDIAEVMHKNGAHYYIRKTNHVELKEMLTYVLTLILEKKFTRPSRNRFLLIPSMYNLQS